jgi:hypothetical protein
MRSSMRTQYIFLSLCALALVWASPFGLAQDLAQQREALKLITDTARDICYTVDQHGTQSETRWSGDAEVKLKGLMSKLAGLGLEGGVEYTTQEYQGVVRDQLTLALKNSDDCRQDVLKTLVDRLLPKQPPTVPPQSQAPPCSDLVDATGSYRLPGAGPTSTPYSALTNEELKTRVTRLASGMKNLEAIHKAKTDSILAAPRVRASSDDQEREQFRDIQSRKLKEDNQFLDQFRQDYLDRARTLHDELLIRLKLPWPICSRSGLSVAGYRALSMGFVDGDAPLSNFADYLEHLVNRLRTASRLPSRAPSPRPRRRGSQPSDERSGGCRGSCAPR